MKTRAVARAAVSLCVPLALVLCCAEAWALIVGRDAESTAAGLEKEGKFKEAAVWRLAAARAFRELIVPFEHESVRAFSQWNKPDLAAICRQRAEVLYPRKVRQNQDLYEQDLQKAGGAAAQEDVQKEAADILARFAPVPTAIPCRLTEVRDREKKGDWLTAGDYREVAARVYLLITVPFFERESERAKDPETRKRFQAETLKYLKLARENFAAAGENYQRAAGQLGGKPDAKSGELAERCRRKVPEMEAEAKRLAPLIAAKEQGSKE